MISLKLIPVAIIGLIILYLASLSFITRNHPIKSATERQLSPCPDKPNCVFSGSQSGRHAIKAFPLLENNRHESWLKLIASIRQAGGEILIEDGHYCHAVFTSIVFRFKDDLEAVINDEAIAIRSASRAGRSDLGQNRKRVEQIRSLYMGPVK